MKKEENSWKKKNCLKGRVCYWINFCSVFTLHTFHCAIRVSVRTPMYKNNESQFPNKYLFLLAYCYCYTVHGIYKAMYNLNMTLSFPHNIKIFSFYEVLSCTNGFLLESSSLNFKQVFHEFSNKFIFDVGIYVTNNM